MKDTCILTNKSNYVDKEGQRHHVIEILAGNDIDTSTGYVSSGKVHRIVLDTDPLPLTAKFGDKVECDVTLSTYFDVSSKSEKTIVRYTSVAPIK